jgi:tetratricopeptide (TPR) repeat protein
MKPITFAFVTMLSAGSLLAQDAAPNTETGEIQAEATAVNTVEAAADIPVDKPPAEVDAKKLFEQGRDALFQGEYKRAITLFEEAAKAEKDGQQNTVRLNLARAYRYDNQVDKSEKLLKEILKESPDHVEAGQLLAEIQHTQQKWQEIIEVLEPLLKYRHDYPTYHMLAEAAYNLDDFAKARKYYEEAVRLNANSALDHYQLGNLHLAESRFARAATSYESAMNLGLESSVLHYKLASSYFNLRNYFGNISAVTVAAGVPGTISGEWYLIERVPGDKDVFRVAPPKSAIYQISKAMEDDDLPKVDIRMLQANTFLSARRYQRAYELYVELGQLVEKQSKEDRALYHFFYAESALGIAKYDEYLAQLRKAIDLDKETYSSALVEACDTVAEKYNQAGNLEKYIEYLKLAVSESPQTASLHLKLGNALEDSKNYSDAVQQWRMVLDLEPDHPQRTKLLNLIKKHVHTLTQKPIDKGT